MLKSLFLSALIAGLILGFIFTLKGLFAVSILAVIVYVLTCLRKDKGGSFFPMGNRASTFYILGFSIMFPFLFGAWIMALAIYLEVFPGFSQLESFFHAIFR